MDVSNIFKNVFPDLTENSLGTVPNIINSARPVNSDKEFESDLGTLKGERRENLLKQAEYYKKRKLHQEKMAEEYLKEGFILL